MMRLVTACFLMTSRHIVFHSLVNSTYLVFGVHAVFVQSNLPASYPAA
jgi:hypothetical protein